MEPPTDFDKTLTRQLLDKLNADEFITMLKQRTLFRDLPPERIPLDTLEQISDSVRVVSLAKNGVLNLRRRSDALYEIISGYVKIYDRALKGRELNSKSVKNPPALLAWRIPGELLGDFRFAVPDAMLDQIVATDDCVLLEIPAGLVHHLAQSYPQIYFNIASNLASKAIKARIRAQILRQPNVNCMVAKMFLEFLTERGYEPVVKDGQEWKLARGTLHIRDIAAFLGYNYYGAQPGVRALIEEGLLAHHLNNRSGRYVCNDAGLRSYLEQENSK